MKSLVIFMYTNKGSHTGRHKGRQAQAYRHIMKRAGRQAEGVCGIDDRQGAIRSHSPVPAQSVMVTLICFLIILAVVKFFYTRGILFLVFMACPPILF